MALPQDPVILLSYVNLQLRDYYSTLDDFCKSMDVDQAELIRTLGTIDYVYDSKANQFR